MEKRYRNKNIIITIIVHTRPEINDADGEEHQQTGRFWSSVQHDML